ncbi:hypothetical protein [Actinomadura oligospora]|uniref:hypothetical protein n=1 Tax=Actinomadura oligospora TaxID=111804 RepID=UPI0012F7AC9E|nr:hypothetical protein [Actinomadura oligospora]
MAEERSLWDGDVESVPGIIGEPAPQASDAAEDTETADPDTMALLQAALARIIELEARNAEQRPTSEPPFGS